jgi:hypothetical protein
LLRSQLRKLEHGEITLVDGDRRDTFGRTSERCALRATLHVRNARFYAETAFVAPSAPASRTWRRLVGPTTDGARAHSSLRIRSRTTATSSTGVDGAPGRAADEGVPQVAPRRPRATTREGSRRNIGAHYDVGQRLLRAVPRPDADVLERVFERPT